MATAAVMQLVAVLHALADEVYHIQIHSPTQAGTVPHASVQLVRPQVLPTPPNTEGNLQSVLHVYGDDASSTCNEVP